MTLRGDALPALAAFEAAARHQNFAHAGEELHLTASAVSHHVRKLEARLGVPLFQRHARGVALTAHGRQLADAASSSLSDLDAVMRDLTSAPDGADEVRIATLHSFTCAWLLPRLPGFTRAHPQLRVSVETGYALARFDEGGPDLAIRYGPGQWPGLTAHVLMDEGLFPVAAPALAAGVHDAQAIPTLPLIGDAARHGWHDWFRHAHVAAAGVQEQYRFSDTAAALAAASQGLGAALARDRIAAPQLADGSLVQLPGPVLRSRWSYHVVHPAHRRLKPAARAFVDWLLAQPVAPSLGDTA